MKIFLKYLHTLNILKNLYPIKLIDYYNCILSLRKLNSLDSLKQFDFIEKG